MNRAGMESAARLAFARRNPATTMARKNCTRAEPKPAEAARTPGSADLAWGANFINVAVRSVDAALHAFAMGAPMIGQLSMPAGGGGTSRVPSRRCAMIG